MRHSGRRVRGFIQWLWTPWGKTRWEAEHSANERFPSYLKIMGHSLFWTFVFLLHTASNTPSTSSAQRSTMRTRCCPHTDSSAAQKLKHLIWTLKLRLFGRHKWGHCMQMLSTEAYDPSSAGQWLVWEKSLAMQSHGALILLFTVTDWKKTKQKKKRQMSA